MTIEERESLTQKVSKLIRHERSARHIGNIAEAEAFATKAQEMMLRYKLELSDVEAADLEKNEPIESVPMFAHQILNDPKLVGAKKQSWLGVLLVGLTKANFCYVLGSGNKQWYFNIVGRKSDRETVQTMAQYLYEAMVEVADKELATYKASATYSASITLGKSPSGLARMFIHGFKVGFASAVSERMRTEREILLESVNEQGLVKLDGIRAQIDDFVKTKFGTVRQGRDVHVRSGGRMGYSAGRKYGSSVGINSNKRLGS